MNYQTTPEAQTASTGGLLSQLIESVTDLFRKETQLLRAEMSEKANQAMVAIGMIVAGAIFALVALDVLAAALVAAIVAAGLAPGWAALLVGGAIALAAIGLMMKGGKDLKAANLAPKKTIRNVRQDAAMAKEAVQ